MTERNLDLGRPAVVWSGDPETMLALRDRWAAHASDVFYDGLEALYDRPHGLVRADCTRQGVDRLVARAKGSGLTLEGVCREDPPIRPARPADFTWMLAAGMDAPLLMLEVSVPRRGEISPRMVLHAVGPYLEGVALTPGTRPTCRLTGDRLTLTVQPMDVPVMAGVEEDAVRELTGRGWAVRTLKRRPYYRLAHSAGK